MSLVKLSKIIMADARKDDNSCIRCGKQDGTVCGRHYNGLRQHSLGKGRGIKANPLAVADFCNGCDAEFAEGSVPKSDWPAYIEKSEEFLFYCLETLKRRVDMALEAIA